MQEKGALPEGEFELEWGDVFDLSAEEDAADDYKKGMTVDKLVSAGVLDKEEGEQMVLILYNLIEPFFRRKNLQ